MHDGGARGVRRRMSGHEYVAARRIVRGRIHPVPGDPQPLRFWTPKLMNIEEKDLVIWRNLWTDGVNLAVHARRFTETHLQASAVR
jgi:hypothetical protein